MEARNIIFRRKWGATEYKELTLLWLPHVDSSFLYVTWKHLVHFLTFGKIAFPIQSVNLIKALSQEEWQQLLPLEPRSTAVLMYDVIPLDDTDDICVRTILVSARAPVAE